MNYFEYIEFGFVNNINKSLQIDYNLIDIFNYRKVSEDYKPDKELYVYK